MYQILIVDDEARDRSIIKILLERQYGEKFHCLEAENGAQALELLRVNRIQLLFLDINMPGLGGIDVLHELPYTPYVIMLTAYSNFEYTREALRYGAKDYLLKPPLRAEFYTAVDRFLQEQAGSPESYSSKGREILTKDLALQLMWYGNPQKIQELLMALNYTGQTVVCGFLHNGQRQGLLAAAAAYLSNLKVEFTVADYRDGIVVFLFGHEKRDISNMPCILETLARSLGDERNGQVRVSKPAPALTGFPKAFLNMMKPSGEKEAIPSVSQAELEQGIRHQDYKAAMEALQPVFEAFGDDSNTDNFLKYELLTALTQCAGQGLSGADYKDARRRLSGLISVASRQQMIEITSQYIQWMIHKRKTARPKHSAVEIVLERIQQDYTRPWSIELLADELHITPYYLSRLFKEYMGQSFTDYLAEQRIEQAVKLMQSTDLNLAQIGEAVGYSDPNYFSRVFKKHKGVAPRIFGRGIKQHKTAN